MIFSLNDSAIMNRILPLHCESYLEIKGWRMIEKSSHKSSVWHKRLSNGKDEYILLPLDTELRDYINRIADAIEVLKFVENRSTESIIADLLQSNSDTFRVIAFKDRAEFSLPLIDAATLLKKSVDMIASAAQSINNPKAYFVSRHPKEVDDFLAKLRMGHTERGSFIVSMHVPVEPRMKDIFTESDVQDDSLKIESEEPFERQVIMQLSKLTALAIDAANTREMKSFTDAIPSGINANFCEALSEITEVCGDDGAHFDISWAPTRAVAKSWNIKTKFHIRPDTANALKEASKQLRKNSIESDIEICGYVVRLDSGDSSESGEIKIIDTLSEKPRHIFLQLDGDKYQNAIDAHKYGKVITVKGNIEKSGKKSTLTNITEFNIIADDD